MPFHPGIPLKRIASTESERLLHLEDDLHTRIVGQNEAIDAIGSWWDDGPCV